MKFDVQVVRLDQQNPVLTLGQRFTWVLRDRLTRTVVLSGYATSRRRAKRIAEAQRRQREGQG